MHIKKGAFMKNYLDKTIFKRIKKDLVAKYGVEKADKIWAYACCTDNGMTTLEGS